MAANDWHSQFRTFLITTASIYIGEMLIFFIALLLYHFCVFLPRVRLKMYKVPQDEASKSLLRISGMLSAEGAVDKTQTEEPLSERHKDDLIQHEVDATDSPFSETNRFIRKPTKMDVMKIPETFTPPSSMRESPGEKTLVSEKTDTPYITPSDFPAKQTEDMPPLERTQRSLRKPLARSPLRFGSTSEKTTPDNPPNSVVLY